MSKLPTLHLIDQIYKKNKKKNWIVSRFSIADGTITKIKVTPYGFVVCMKTDDGEYHNFPPVTILNVILGEWIRSDHLIGYIYKGE